MKNILMAGCVCLLAIESVRAALTNAPTAAAPPRDSRHGLFGWLDNRSSYGQGVFPEPFLVDDSEAEEGEARLDWLHTAAGSSKTDVLHPEVEWGFDLLTLELEAPYEWDRSGGMTTEGFDNVDIGARYPIYQYVTPNGVFDSTFGAGIEAGIPTESSVSKNAELVPKVFGDLKVGNFTMQSILGCSRMFGPGDNGGLQTLEYGFVFGYTIQRDQAPLPGVEQVIPVFELRGEREMNKDRQSSLLGDAALRLNLKAIGRIQPRPGVGFVFPLDRAAREGAHWGVFTSLVIEF